MDSLTFFGFVVVSLMVAFYAFEHRSRWFILCFAISCVLASLYAYLQGALPFAFVEVVWAGVALRRWWVTKGTVR